MWDLSCTSQDRTLVGRPDAGHEPNDIQLSGVGIETHHSVLSIENSDLFIEPHSSARTCVNGSQVIIFLTRFFLNKVCKAYKKQGFLWLT